ncbi:MAG: amino acid ABC transporter substrate-binding protein [Halanaeroarchaeum sp.]
MKETVNRRSYLKIAGATGAVGLTSLAGCSGETNGNGTTTGGTQSGTNSVLFGATVSLTGSLSTNGTLTKQGYNLWQSFANRNGGIDIGGETYEVKLKLYDDQSKASTAQTQYQKLVTQDDVDLLLGPYSSGMTRSVGPIAESNEIPMIAGGAASKEVYTQGWDYVYGTLPLANTYMKNVVEMAAGFENPPERVGIIHVNSLFPTGVAKGAEKAVKNTDALEFVFRESYPAGTTSLSSLVNQAKNQNVDMVLGGTHTQTAIQFVKDMQSYAYSPDAVAFSVGPPTPDFRNALGNAANYIYGVTMWLPGMDYKGPYIGTASNYATMFKEQFDTVPDYHAASTTADGLVFQHAMEKAGSYKAKEVEAQLDQITVEDPLTTFYGPVGFSKGQLGTRGANLSKAAGVLQIQDGSPVLVYPGGQKPQYPMPAWDER